MILDEFRTPDRVEKVIESVRSRLTSDENPKPASVELMLNKEQTCDVLQETFRKMRRDNGQFIPKAPWTIDVRPQGYKSKPHQVLKIYCETARSFYRVDWTWGRGGPIVDGVTGEPTRATVQFEKGFMKTPEYVVLLEDTK